MIFHQMRALIENRLTESIGKPKDLRKALKLLGLFNKISSCEGSVLKTNNTVEHDINSLLKSFENDYSDLAQNLISNPF